VTISSLPRPKAKAQAEQRHGKTASETKHHGHPYIPTLLRGSIARLKISDTMNRIVGLTRIAEQNNLFSTDQARFRLPAARIPSST